MRRLAHTAAAGSSPPTGFRRRFAAIPQAIAHGYVASNPVRALPKAEKPRPARKESAYFASDELPQLSDQFADGVYRTLFLIALKTGMRQGELLALSRCDIDLSAAVTRVCRTYTAGHLGTPKNHERRDVDLTSDLVDRLGSWWGELGRPGDDKLVFPGESGAEYLTPPTLLKRELYPAMEMA